MFGTRRDHRESAQSLSAVPSVAGGVFADKDPAEGKIELDRVASREALDGSRVTRAKGRPREQALLGSALNEVPDRATRPMDLRSGGDDDFVFAGAGEAPSQGRPAPRRRVPFAIPAAVSNNVTEEVRYQIDLKDHVNDPETTREEDFRNDRVDAAELAAEEAGNAIYQVEFLPEGRGEIGTVSVRFQDTESGRMVEREWIIPYEPRVPRLENSAASLRLAAGAVLLGEKLKGSQIGESVEMARLGKLMNGLTSDFPSDQRVKELVQMTNKARELSGR